MLDVGTSTVLLILGAFLASAVEMVEALTIVLAALVAALGPALRVVPIDTLRLLVGALLLAFGMQWLRKAILRASGHVSLHDEGEAFSRRRAEAATAGAEERAGLDWYAFTVAFKGVLLEGLEVVFIVISFGSAQSRLGLAAAGAAAAVVLVTLAGILVRGPLERVPENTIKFAVGLLLTSFGCFWGAEGAGATWPGDELSLLGVLGFLGLLSVVLVRLLRRQPSGVLPSGAKA